MDYQHLTTFERGRIEALHNLGYTVREIGQQMNRHHSTIARELSRNNNANYCCETAQEGYFYRRKASKPKGKCSPELVIAIEHALDATWSPEQISNTITKGKISFKTIYRWLYSGKVSKGNFKVLRHKGKRHKPAEKRGKFIIGTSIHQRPKEVKSRETFGHWELDTVVSSRGESKGCFATFVERKTRLYTAIKIADRTASSMESAIKQLHAVLPKNAFKTTTVDRGKEFACYKNIENDIGLTLFLPTLILLGNVEVMKTPMGYSESFTLKKLNLALADEKKLMNNLFLINSRPRKCLGWKSPIQIFLHEVSHLT